MNTLSLADLTHGAMRQEDRHLLFGLGISFLLHVLVLSVHFQYPEATRSFGSKALDIILVNSKSATRPSDPQAYAQNDLDGGGNSDRDDVRASTPFPYSEHEQDGSGTGQTAQRRGGGGEARQRQVMLSEVGRSDRGDRKRLSRQVGTGTGDGSGDGTDSGTPSGVDLADGALAMARLQGEISREYQAYNSRPRKRFVGVRTIGIVEAQYVEDWRMKVERVGTLNYPSAAKGRLYGSLMLTVSIAKDGNIDSIEINRSSGHKVLDDAARRIVTMAGPYPPFTPAMLKEFEVLVITRNWSFTSGDRLETRR
ncbi:MAG: TonB family protein [Candidatus Accumulibacter sp.]|nr:TonB family protein [Accumulibacter sp.]